MADSLTRVRRHPERGSNDKDLLLDILESGLVCQIAFQLEGQPFIIPMSYYNDPNFIYFHGSPAARISNVLRSGISVAISVLELNGLVIAKGMADNSINYRSVVIFGRPEEVSSEEEKLTLFKEWIDHLMPGRKQNTEMPNHAELKSVSLFKMKLDQFSVKVRKGGPLEVRKSPEIWSGVVPFSYRFHNPEFSSSAQIPGYVKDFIDVRNGDKD